MEFKSCDIFGCSKYEVSKCGTVVRIISNQYQLKFRNNHGYNWVYLYDDNKKRLNIPVHKLVLAVFTNDKREYPKWEIDHINGINNDNRLENLRYVTHYENMNNPLTLKKMSEKRIGKRLSKETKDKISKKHLGTHLSEETKQKIANSIKGKHWKIDEVTGKRIWY